MPQRELMLEAIRAAAAPADIFDRVITACLALVAHADGAALARFCNRDTLEYVAAAGTLEAFRGTKVPSDGSLSGLAVSTGRIQRSDDVRKDIRVNMRAARETGILSMLCMPLDTGDDAPAVLTVSAKRLAAFGDADIATLRDVGDFLGAILRAAAETARATEVMLERAAEQNAGQDVKRKVQSMRTARFVADIVNPGLATRVDAAAIVAEVVRTRNVQIQFQPIVDLADGSVVSVEALARFNLLPDRAPDWWFHLAAQVGWGRELQTLAVERALELFPLLPAHLRMAVNAGPELLVDPHFIDIISTAPLDRLTVEVTEHTRVDKYPRLLSAVAELRAMGVRISVDDAGSGYSGLNHIRQLVPDVLKLDRELTIGVHEDPVRQALAAALVGFAHRVGAVIIAEGIEVEAESDMMRSLGVQFGQGYLLGRPQRAEVMFGPQI